MSDNAIGAASTAPSCSQGWATFLRRSAAERHMTVSPFALLQLRSFAEFRFQLIQRGAERGHLLFESLHAHGHWLAAHFVRFVGLGGAFDDGAAGGVGPAFLFLSGAAQE